MQYIQSGKRQLFAAFFLLITPMSSWAAYDQLLQPFAIRNLNPFIGVYGIPAMQSSFPAPTRSSTLHVTLDTVSHFTDAGTEREFISIDGESYRLAFRFSHVLNGGWEIGAEVPLLKHSGGFLDGFLNDFHDFFRLPGLGRDQVADDQLLLTYTRDGEQLVGVQSTASGLGDILLFTTRALRKGDDGGLMLHGQLKLPTGDSDQLLGSGAADASIWASARRDWGNGWSATARLGGAYLGTGDVLPQLQRNWVGFGGALLAWQVAKPVALKLQLDAQSSVYSDSDLDQLADPAAQFTLGLSIRAGKSALIDFGVTEDEINPDVSSDVSFQLRLRVRN